MVEIDLVLAGHAPITAVARIDHCEPDAGGAAGRFDVGLRLVRLESGAASRHASSAALEARADALRDALARLLETRDAYLGALGTNPVVEEALAEEVDYLSAIRAARSILKGSP